jgi:hypothetical protein
VKSGGSMMCVRVCVCVCVCVQKDDVADNTMPSHNSRNSEAAISYANAGPKTEM